MFQSLSILDADLQKAVKNIQNSFVGENLIAAQIFEVPAIEFVVGLLVSQPSQLTILEEFILRASTELKHGPTETELAEALALNHIFIHSECKNMALLEVFDESKLPKIVPTDKGIKFYKERSIVRPNLEEKYNAYWDCLTEEVTFFNNTISNYPKATSGQGKKLPVPYDSSILSDNEKAISVFTVDCVRDEIVSSGIYRPEDAHLITKITSVKPLNLVWRPIGVLAINDVVDQKLLLRVVNLETGKFSTKLESILNIDIQDKKDDDRGKESTPGELVLASMNVFHDTSNEDIKLTTSELPNYVSEIEDKVRQKLSLERSLSNKNLNKIKPTHKFKELSDKKEDIRIKLLKDAEIRPCFLEVITNAKSEIIIVSPWITEKVLDAAFLELLQKKVFEGVLIVMGWGIATMMDNDIRNENIAFNKKIKSIKTPNGAPGIAIVWLGNQHIKEVVIDRQKHLLGSHNFLSYRGDNNFRGESVYYVEERKQVDQALDHLEKLFIKALNREWTRYLRKRSERAILSLCATSWVALNREDIAIEATKNLLEKKPDRKEDAVEFLRLLCLCLQAKASTKNKSMVKFLSELNELVDQWALFNNDVANCKELEKILMKFSKKH